MIQIYGASDDVVVVKGDITEEFTPSSAPAELVGWLGAHAADPDDWQFFYEGDADPDDYEIVRPAYAPIGSNNNTDKETP